MRKIGKERRVKNLFFARRFSSSRESIFQRKSLLPRLGFVAFVFHGQIKTFIREVRLTSGKNGGGNRGGKRTRKKRNERLSHFSFESFYRGRL